MRHLTKRGRIWHYDFTLGGHRFQGSTKSTDLETARLVLAEVQKSVVLGRHGLKTPPTLKAAVEAWTTRKGSSVSSRHLQTAELALRYLQPLATERCDRLTTNAVEAWRSGFLTSRSPATANLVLRYLKAWCRWLVECRELEAVPFKLKPVRFERRQRPVLRAEQVEAFLAEFDRKASTQARAAVRVMLGTGMREGEVLAMRWNLLDGARYTVTKTKGKRSRVVILPASALPLLDALPGEHLGLVFPAEDGKPHRASWLTQAIQRAARVAGIEGAMGNHRLRASFASLHHAAGTPLGTIQAMMGHTRIETTLGYIETGLEEQERAQAEVAKRTGLG